MFEPLFDHIRRFAALDTAAEEKLTNFLEYRVLKKREHLLHFGEVSNRLAFVQSGCLRLYHVNDFANERTLQFALEGWWMVDWDSFEKIEPSIFSIQAVEASSVTIIHQKNFETMFETLPSMERYFRRIFQRINTAAQRRTYMIDTESAESRYWNFQEQFSDFVNRVPQYMLASFLGISPEFLSKIRARGRDARSSRDSDLSQ